MCGISGFLSKELRAGSTIKEINSSIIHRGPDDEGYALFDVDGSSNIYGGKDTPKGVFSENISYAPSTKIEESRVGEVNVALGHRRLSILDLSPLGHQPMCTSDQRYWIVYNGEIYNYLELRNELVKLGHHFSSNSDTEVILLAFQEWGTDCLYKFNGMWALAIFDAQNQTLFLSRDRFGIKPLYYWISPDNTFYFGSEIKQFCNIDGWNPLLNSQRAYDFLAWGVTDHTDETLFKGVYQLKPGSYSHLNAKKSIINAGEKIESHKWFSLRPSDFKGSIEDATEIFRELLIDSVRLRLRSDVPSGSCLSGGLDSSSIVCIIDDLLSHNGEKTLQKTFSAYSDIEKYSEKKWIDEVVSSSHAEAHFVKPSSQELFEKSAEITRYQDEPFGSTTIYAQWKVFELARQNNVKVMLDGQGADELLAGYHNFYGPRLFGLLSSGKAGQLIKEIESNKKLHGLSILSSLMHLANMILPDNMKQPLRRMLGRTSVAPKWLDLEVLGAKPMDPMKTSGHGGKKIRDMSCSQITATNLPMLLHWEDRNSMAHSIESRVPFLDYRLVEFALSLPDEYKLFEGISKRVQRESMNGIIPKRIMNRRDKLGFITAEELWLRKTDTNVFRTRMDRAVEASCGIINNESRNMLESIITKKLPFSSMPWRLISFGEWVDEFNIQIDR